MGSKPDTCSHVRGSGCAFFGDVGAAGDCRAMVQQVQSPMVTNVAYGPTPAGRGELHPGGHRFEAAREADSGDWYIEGGGALYGCTASPGGTALGMLVVLMVLARRNK